MQPEINNLYIGRYVGNLQRETGNVYVGECVRGKYNWPKHFKTCLCPQCMPTRCRVRFNEGMKEFNLLACQLALIYETLVWYLALVPWSLCVTVPKHLYTLIFTIITTVVTY